VDEDGPVAQGWLRHVGELHRTLLPGDHGDGPHGLTVANEAAARTAGVLVIALASRTSAPGSPCWDGTARGERAGHQSARARSGLSASLRGARAPCLNTTGR